MPGTPRHRQLLGEQLRIRRKAAGLTQEKLAEMADLNRNYVGEVERGEKTISVDALVRLAVAVKVRVRDLVHEL